MVIYQSYSSLSVFQGESRDYRIFEPIVLIALRLNMNGN